MNRLNDLVREYAHGLRLEYRDVIRDLGRMYNICEEEMCNREGIDDIFSGNPIFGFMLVAPIILASVPALVLVKMGFKRKFNLEDLKWKL